MDIETPQGDAARAGAEATEVAWEQAYRELEEQTARMLRGIGAVMARLERRADAGADDVEGSAETRDLASEAERLRRDSAEREKKVAWLRSRLGRATDRQERLKGENRRLKSALSRERELVEELSEQLLMVQKLQGSRRAGS